MGVMIGITDLKETLEGIAKSYNSCMYVYRIIGFFRKGVKLVHATCRERMVTRQAALFLVRNRFYSLTAHTGSRYVLAKRLQKDHADLVVVALARPENRDIIDLELENIELSLSLMKNVT